MIDKNLGNKPMEWIKTERVGPQIKRFMDKWGGSSPVLRGETLMEHRVKADRDLQEITVSASREATCAAKRARINLQPGSTILAHNTPDSS
ncbi:MAG: hypothetical protein Q8N98_04500, partial [bacterium]|nr:hypothetical protein [bacterium]